MTRIVSPPLVLLVLALCVSARASADARRDYLDGLRAYREGRLAEAVVALERATAERPKEEARARLVGAIPEPYLPWHFLGLALARQGDCGRALTAWERSAADGVAARLPERAQELHAVRTLCPPEPVGEARPVEPPPIPTDQQPVALPEADLLPRPTREVPRKVPGTLLEGTLLEGLGGPGRPPSAPPASPETNVQAPEQVPGTLSSSSSSSSSQSGLPSYFEAAADRFGEGDYRGTLSALEGLPGAATSRERALADLLRSAAYFALHELGGRGDPATLEQATAAARRTRTAAPDLLPDATVFAPRFVDWFASVRQSLRQDLP